MSRRRVRIISRRSSRQESRLSLTSGRRGSRRRTGWRPRGEALRWLPGHSLPPPRQAASPSAARRPPRPNLRDKQKTSGMAGTIPPRFHVPSCTNGRIDIFDHLSSRVYRVNKGQAAEISLRGCISWASCPPRPGDAETIEHRVCIVMCERSLRDPGEIILPSNHHASQLSSALASSDTRNPTQRSNYPLLTVKLVTPAHTWRPAQKCHA